MFLETFLPSALFFRCHSVCIRSAEALLAALLLDFPPSSWPLLSCLAMLKLFSQGLSMSCDLFEVLILFHLSAVFDTLTLLLTFTFSVILVCPSLLQPTFISFPDAF